MEIKIERTTAPKPKPDQKALGFGKYLTDHMFLMDYNPEKGWHDFRIVPYGPIPMEPDAVALHYAQETFEGLKAYPVKILVEDEYVRAVKGGTGFAKCGGNYAGAMIGQEKAERLGYSQVLWLDGAQRKYVEEAGGMNFIYSINGEFWTAPTEGTVLPGITRDSILHILRHWGIPVREERMDIDTLMAAGHDGSLQEAFACGTAAVISPVGALNYKGDEVIINSFKIGETTQKLYDYLTGIQWGNIEDKFGWTMPVK